MPIQCTCQACGKTYYRSPALARRGSLYCSDACRYAPRPLLPGPDDSSLLVPLTQGKFAIIDAEDAELVGAFSWHVATTNNGETSYASTKRPAEMGGGALRMHQLIMNAPRGVIYDHWDRDGLNNRRANLRLATKRQNGINTRIRPDNTSGFRGVSFARRNGKWAARLNVNGQSRWIGYFSTAEEAANAYDRAAIDQDPEFAVLNFPEEHEAAHDGGVHPGPL